MTDLPDVPNVQPDAGHPSGRVAKPKRGYGDPVAVAKQHPAYIPPPATNRSNLNLPLFAVMPDEWITNAGKIVLHVVGDTGGVNGSEVQDAIAAQMEAQVQAAPAPEKPAFFYNLGDVIYYNGQSSNYRWQFYEPYQYYQPYIFAIPGNHDGDTNARPNDQPVTEPSLTGFMANFCDEQAQYHFTYRATMTQPYVYWTLNAPLVTIVGLYSNVDGTLDGRGSFEQQSWLRDQLAAAPADRCLLVAVHHPPFSLDRVHGGCPDILTALDRAIQASGRTPDAVFSGHVHSYQRFTRRTGQREIPFLVAGAGGYAHTAQAMHKLQANPHNGQPFPQHYQTRRPDVKLEHFNDTDPGFLRLTIDQQTLRAEYFLVPFATPETATLEDAFTLNWTTHLVTEG